MHAIFINMHRCILWIKYKLRIVNTWTQQVYFLPYPRHIKWLGFRSTTSLKYELIEQEGY